MLAESDEKALKIIKTHRRSLKSVEIKENHDKSKANTRKSLKLIEHI